jgi:polyferredoxin
MEEFFDSLITPRTYVGALSCAMAMVFLMKAWLSRNLRLLSLPIIFFVFGALWLLPLGSFADGMGPHPSPLCTVTKPFLFVKAGFSIPIVFFATFAAIAVLSIAGNKLFCGWVCPIGALQELAHRVPLPSNLKKRLPFKVTNTIRVLLAVAFAPVVVFAGVSIYDYFNPFEMLHWHYYFDLVYIVGAVLIASFFIFRPFCYLICPLGLLTWILEHMSIVKVKVDMEKCTECDICVDESPCPSVRAILDRRVSRPDCHACGRCIELCPEDALKFR